jgi:GDP-4-dehydro-6-deoxy-D-mannose reductase
MKTILVTGANGFVGRHLVRELHDNGLQVVGVGGPALAAGSEGPNISDYRVCDLTNNEQVTKLDFRGIDAVIHLAGLANIGMSFAQPARFISDNGSITINLLETLLQQGVKPRVVIISSGAVYSPQQKMPITENGELTTSSPYVVSKLLTENVSNYYRSRGIECVIARPFNHIGPGQGPGFLLPDLAAQIKEAALNRTEVVVGNLASKRDYTDVRDVAKAYRLLATAGKLEGTVYNVCSGKSVAGQYFLDELLGIIAPNDRPAVTVDKGRFRPNDAPDIVGDSSLLQEETGWRPSIPLEQTIRDFIVALG